MATDKPRFNTEESDRCPFCDEPLVRVKSVTIEGNDGGFTRYECKSGHVQIARFDPRRAKPSPNRKAPPL